MDRIRDVVVDVETTGTAADDRVISVGLVRLDQSGDVVDDFYTLVNPHRDTGPVSIHGITTSMVQNAPDFKDIIPDLKYLLGSATFVAHNAAFDYRMVANEFDIAGKPFNMDKLCTYRVAKSLHLPVVNHKLSTLLEYFDIPQGQAHHALHDAYGCASLLVALRDERRSRS